MFYEFKVLTTETSSIKSINHSQEYITNRVYEISGIICSDNIESDIKVLETHISDTYKIDEYDLKVNIMNDENVLDRYWRVVDGNLELVRIFSSKLSKAEQFLNGFDIEIRRNTQRALINRYSTSPNQSNNTN